MICESFLYLFIPFNPGSDSKPRWKELEQGFSITAAGLGVADYYL